MELVELNPNDIHFGDPVLENDWDRPVPEELAADIRKRGILNPIIVHHATPHLKDKYLHIRQEKGNWLWCFRGTARLRIARFMRMPTIKALVLDEDMDNPPNRRQVQKCFNKRINLFFNSNTQRWDTE